MTNSTARIPPYFLDFMDSVNLNNHDHIVLRANAYADDDTCVELDVRLHSTEPELQYIVGYINEYSCFNHPKTGEGMHKALLLTKMLDFPDDTPRVDDYYLGPFNEEIMLEVIEAADHTAARLDADKRIRFLESELARAKSAAESFRESSRERGSIVSNHKEIEKAREREERKKHFTVIQGGKSNGPQMG